MWRYIVQRCLWLILIAICVGALVFTVMYFVPGDPAMMILGSEATEAELDAYRELLGLKDPYYVRLLRYLYDTFIRWDLGTSYTYKVSVMSQLMERIPRTLLLGVTCIVINASIGIPIGIVCALHRNQPLDHGLMVISMIGISIPGFWLALMMVILFSLKLNLLPPFGFGGIEYWIMPIIANSVNGIAVNARQTRSAVLETIRADFVTTARAKGLSENKVVYKHMLPNALVPVVNSLGGAFARSIAGTVVIESVFSFPGVGTYMMKGISNRDYPVVCSSVLILALFSATVVLLVDLVYAYLDPRIKAQYANVAAKKRKV